MTAATRKLLARARELHAQKQFVPARDICAEILTRDPAQRVALYLLASCEVCNSQYEQAVAALTRLVGLYPDHVNGLVLLSKALLSLGDHRRSVQYARRVLELNVGDDRVLALLADILGRSADHAGARAAYEAAIRINPGNPAHLCNYASILRIEGRVAEAAGTLEQCIELDPAHCKAHWMLSSLHRQTVASNHIRRLEQVRDSARLSIQGRLLIEFALAKEYEDIGEFEKSFGSLSEACRRKRRSIDYEVEADTLPLRQLEEQFDPQYVERMSGSGYTDYGPIFIVGLPRTGSTLIEQILGASERLFAAGELPTLGVEIARALHADRGGAIDYTTLGAIDVDYRELGRAYVESSMAFIESARPGAAFDRSLTFIDKMPQNFVYLGFIMLALPNAKVIVTQRNPMDTCLGNYRQLYNDPFYRFSYRMDEMGAYFIACQRLMQHWMKLFGRRIFTMQYEAFVASPDEVAKTVFDHCGVPWQREYLERSRRGRLVATASATQVREPISLESVDRWKAYEEQLAPLLEQLRQAGVLS